MVLKTSTVKELENELITDYMVGPSDVINNLINIYLNYINN